MSEQKVNITRLGISLGIISAIAAAALSAVYLVTIEPIKKVAIDKTNSAFAQVMPGFDNNPSEEFIAIKSADGRDVKFYIIKQKNKLIGFAGEGTSPKGFNGNVTAIVGILPHGEIKKVVITQHKETAGLGTVITDRKRQKTIFDVVNNKVYEGLPPNQYLDQFTGMSAYIDENWKVKKDGGDIDAKSGATISTRAVTDAVYLISSTYNENMAKLLKEAK